MKRTNEANIYNVIIALSIVMFFLSRVFRFLSLSLSGNGRFGSLFLHDVNARKKKLRNDMKESRMFYRWTI